MEGTKQDTRKIAEKAGATPPCRLFSRPGIRGIAPAFSSNRFPVSLHPQIKFVMRSVLQSKKEGESHMALLKAPSSKPKATNLQVRLEEEVRRNLDRYVEFLSASPSYVVSEALKLLFRKDNEFKVWTD